MKELIEAFPDNILESLAIAKTASIQPLDSNVSSIVICGMGGSGIGGRLVAQWVSTTAKIPVLFVQDYQLPAFVGPNTLVIGSSYSGNTEETLIALEEAKAKNCRIIGICSGGKLESFCKENSYDLIVVPGGNPPRSALAYSLIQLAGIMDQLGISAGNLLQEVKSAHDLIVAEQAAIRTLAMDAAKVLQKKVVAVYAGADYEAVSIRAKQQFNENSKELCWQHAIPEMNHNELVGWGGGDDRHAALFLQTPDLYFRNQRRFEISIDIVKKKTNNVVVVESKGNTRVERTIYLINVIDWISLYLSELKNGDPIEIVVIDYLKDELSKL